MLIASIFLTSHTFWMLLYNRLLPSNSYLSDFGRSSSSVPPEAWISNSSSSKSSLCNVLESICSNVWNTPLLFFEFFFCGEHELIPTLAELSRAGMRKNTGSYSVTRNTWVSKEQQTSTLTHLEWKFARPALDWILCFCAITYLDEFDHWWTLKFRAHFPVVGRKCPLSPRKALSVFLRLHDRLRTISDYPQQACLHIS